MIHKIPDYWETILKNYLKRTFYPGTRKEGFAEREGFMEGDYRFFSRGVSKLNEFFTVERGALPKNYFNQKDLRSGYLLYFLPVNALKVAALLQEIPPSPPFSKGGLTILDVGSGPGTGMFGTFLWLENLIKTKQIVSEGRFPSGANDQKNGFQMGGNRGESGIAPRSRIQLRWILIDQNPQALRDAQNLHEELLKQLRSTGVDIQSRVETKVVDLSTRFSKILGSTRADLILSLNLLSELPESKRLTLIETLTRYHLSDQGRYLLIEPALQRTTRDLMELHDLLISRRSAAVFAPCLHQAECPMLKANRRDWCHTYIEWERPEWIRKLDYLVGIRKDYLKCSYLLLGKEPVQPGDLKKWRVVSGHLNSNGKSELLLCGPATLPDLLRVTRLDRDRSEANRLFDEVQRGEVIKMDRTTRIGKETQISNPSTSLGIHSGLVLSTSKH